MQPIRETVVKFNETMAANVKKYELMKEQILEALNKGSIREDDKNEFVDLVTEITLGTQYIQNALKAAIIVEHEAMYLLNRVDPKGQ